MHTDTVWAVSPRPQASRIPLYAVVLLVYTLSLVILGTVLKHHSGFPLDDSWIHQSIGRNLAQSGSLGYLPHQRSSGSTSLLWTILLAANYKFLPFVSPIAYTVALNVLCLFATGMLLLHAALSDGLRPFLAVLWAVAPALDGNYVWLAFTGMEHLLFVAISLLAITLWLTLVRSGGRAGTATFVGAGLALGLLGITRPEGVVLVALLLIAYPFLVKSRPVGPGYYATATLALGLSSISFLINLLTSHSLLPLTLKGRRFLYFTGHGSALNLRLELIEQWIMRPFKMVAPVDGQQVHGFVPHLAFLLAVTVLAGLWGSGLWSLVRRRRPATALICGWGILHSMLYVVILPSSGHAGRYQTFLLLLTLPLLAVGVAALLERWPLAAPLAAAVLVAAVGVRSIPLWRNVLISGIDHINGSHGVAADWIDTHLPGRSIAVFDIGRIGYDRTRDRANPPVVDLGGLTDASYLPYLLEGRVPEYLDRHNVHYAVFPVDEEGQSVFLESLHFGGSAGVQRKPLFRACSPQNVRDLSWVETRNASPCQEVDELVPRK